MVPEEEFVDFTDGVRCIGKHVGESVEDASARSISIVNCEGGTGDFVLSVLCSLLESVATPAEMGPRILNERVSLDASSIDAVLF